MKLRKNDTVLVVTGKDKGKKGKIRQAFPKEERVIVDGVNMIKRHSRSRGGARQSGIIEMEASLHVSKLMLICNKCNKPARVGFRFLEDGGKARICRSCYEVID